MTVWSQTGCLKSPFSLLLQSVNCLGDTFPDEIVVPENENRRQDMVLRREERDCRGFPPCISRAAKGTPHQRIMMQSCSDRTCGLPHTFRLSFPLPSLDNVQPRFTHTTPPHTHTDEMNLQACSTHTHTRPRTFQQRIEFVTPRLGLTNVLMCSGHNGRPSWTCSILSVAPVVKFQKFVCFLGISVLLSGRTPACRVSSATDFNCT